MHVVVGFRENENTPNYKGVTCGIAFIRFEVEHMFLKEYLNFCSDESRGCR